VGRKEGSTNMREMGLRRTQRLHRWRYLVSPATPDVGVTDTVPPAGQSAVVTSVVPDEVTTPPTHGTRIVKEKWYTVFGARMFGGTWTCNSVDETLGRILRDISRGWRKATHTSHDKRVMVNTNECRSQL
jgi:hypothetical protein